MPSSLSHNSNPNIEYSNRRAQLINRLRWPLLAGLVILVTMSAWIWGAPVSIGDLWSRDEVRADVARRIFWRADGDWGLRPLRLCAGLLIGASLATSGACLQSVFRNPLAEPFLLGISSGGALGATLGLWMQKTANYALDLTWIFALCGALFSSWLVYILGARTATSSVRSSTRTSNRGALLLTGVAISAFLSAIISLVLALSSSADLAQQIVFWTMGTLTRVDARQNVVLLIALFAGLAILFASSRDLNALRSGDDEAAALGVDVRALHVRLLFAAALMSAVAVASAGLIGFIGLLAPHMVRKLFGHDARVLVPASALGGAALLVGCDALARSLVAGIELPVGIITSLLGVPLFLWLARRSF